MMNQAIDWQYVEHRTDAATSQADYDEIGFQSNPDSAEY